MTAKARRRPASASTLEAGILAGRGVAPVSAIVISEEDTGSVDRVLTNPHASSALRLAGVPVFLWLVLGPQTATADYWAVALLILAGLSDWLDGKIARALNQSSRLGQVLDPAADRLY